MCLTCPLWWIRFEIRKMIKEKIFSKQNHIAFKKGMISYTCAISPQYWYYYFFQNYNQNYFLKVTVITLQFVNVFRLTLYKTFETILSLRRRISILWEKDFLETFLSGKDPFLWETFLLWSSFVHWKQPFKKSHLTAK